ncbi:MAG: von Willebrand factor type A domain-containing protein [Vulcanimicrobiota bacterium]
MRKLVLTLLSVLVLTTLAGAEPTYKDGRITAEFVNADIVYVIKCIAKAMNRNVFVGPTVQGTVTISFQDEPAESALQKLFASLTQEYDYKILEHTVVVATPEKLSEIPDDILDARRAKEYTPPAPSADAPAPPAAARRPTPRPVKVASPGEFNTESYDYVGETGYREVAKRPLSTFSIDVDTASYANLRRFLNDGNKPPKDAVRIEELVNYFSYDYPEPQGPVPFAVNTELSECPWNADHQLLRIGLQGRRIKEGATPPRNLVFLIDISGSMQSPDKLPLLQRALGLLVKKLDDQDRIAIVVYAGAEGLALPSTSGDQQETIEAVINNLRAGGSTNGADGITLAYQVARENFKPGAINRVILATDGDFNVGITDRGSLERLIEQERESGVFLTVLGFGTGNLKDSTMEQLADKGNGNYAYIDSLMEGQKVLVREAGSTLVTIAKDVKLQVEFNPTQVSSYRLVGYENRRLEDEDFDNDKKDAGELGAGHSVTALYELVPAGKPGQDQPLRYQSARQPNQAHADELAQVKLRYKLPDEDTSRVMAIPIKERLLAFEQASLDHRFATAVAAFGMVMRESEHKGSAELGKVANWASESVGRDRSGDRHEFVRLVELARSLELDRAAR